VKIRAIAANTFANLLRNKLILLICAGFVCILMLFMTPLLMLKSMASTMGAESAAQMAMSEVSVAMTLIGGFGSLLAAWAAADAASSEVKSGTILAVLARPVRRWEFLLGKYLGVMLLMAVYVAFRIGMSYLLASIGGQRLHGSPLPFIVYPLARYAVYAAIGMLLGVLMHPVLAFGAVLVIAELASMVAPSGGRPAWMPAWIHDSLYLVLPSTHLLSEERFLQITQASIHSVPWSDHLTALTYGLDYAAACFLLAAWAFRGKSLTRE
jgi:ABC-type transport system involved in multi-copper enzyme maturation permease subunit